MGKNVFYMGWSDFRNKYSTKYKYYHPAIVKSLFETVGGVVLEEEFGNLSFRDLIQKIRIDLREKLGLEILHPEEMSIDLLEYFLGQKNAMRM
jgi:hypothetical protein